MFSVVSGSLSGGSGVGEEKRLDAMNAVCVYVSTAQLVLQFDTTDSNGLGEQRMLDLSRLFGQLRQLLSCAVCARLLNDPYEPLNNARCQHNVCRLCVRGRKALRPLCINCKDLQDFKTYTENKTMRCLLLCYKSLCEHLLSSNFYTHLSRQKAHQALTCSGENVFGVAPMPHMTTCGDIIQEGARYDDILNAFNADLPQIGPTIKLQNTLLTIPAAVTSLPNQSTPSVSAVTPLAPLLVPQKRVQTHTAPRLSTSPITPAATTSNSITLLPTHTAIIKREQTNNQGNSSTPSNAHILMTSKVNVTNQQQQQQQAHGQSHMLYVRNIKTSASESNNIQTPHLCATQSIVGTSHSSIASLSAPPTITYVGPNTPGIVVPIVSSSATTTAPLTIASAKLQSLKRQLAQAQARGGAPISIASAVKAAGITNSDTNASVTFKVSAAGITTTSSLISSASTGAVASPTSVTSATATTTTATITSQQIRNPPSIKTVSNGSAMYSVLYTGVGNKITIKRKTDGDEENGQRTVATANSPVSTSTSTPPAISNSVITTQQQSQANKLNAKRRGCRCGNATPTPGKLTCCGQRCPCYVDSKSCIGCKCRGCRNPHRPDGGKVRPVIPELACYEIQVADETPRLSPSELQVGTTLSTRPRNTSTATTTSPQQHPTHQQAITIVSEQQSTSSTALSSPSPSIATVTSQLHLTPNSSSPSSKGATLIPFISLHPISSQQQQQQQQTQTVTTISSNQHQTNMLPMESVLIQNAEGKYQVVNVVTTGQAHHQHSNSNIQRIHSIPQLQVTSSANGSSNHSNTLLSNLTTVNILTNTSTSNTTTSPSTATTKSSHQSVLLQQQPHLQQHRVQQQQQQKHHQQQIHGQRLVSSHLITTSANNMPTSVTSGKCVAANSLPLQLQHHHHQQQQQQQSQMHNNTHTQNQQVKQNIVTMRPATISNNNMHHTQTLTPILSSSATTITLSPIIVSSSPNTFKAEMFSDSMESEYLNFTTGAVTSTTMVNSGSNNTNMLSTIYSHSGLSNASTSTRITSVPSLSSGSTGSGSGSASRMSLGMNMNITGAGSHITPALVEVIEASDM
ncbi:serine-rich adhesin for platelets isoform X2 [Bactrocera dorsalis]|uniref:Serine-rich adhesin for platelets isoform X2 n=1 Tax=Bactrocera dorsalis TaxID=27457 RepID=A0A8N4QHE2_BACDO|nr:serine-rich adhesin for platelets isoform X2 [Bactrocera dorsalis]